MASAQTGGAAATGSDLRIDVYRVLDPSELAHLHTTGDYGSSPALSGKYFALTFAGARSFASAPMNVGCAITITTLPQSIVTLAFAFNDPGQSGAGSSIFLDQAQLQVVYAAMTPPAVV
ncbi:MAG: hypothetical protein ABSE20_26500 [Acetobacteraceae bacterium]|jgi:hypothetical protein